MAGSLNTVQIIGNLTKDPEIRETPNGQKVASFSVATSRTWKDANDQKQEDTEFHNVIAWRGLADIMEKYTEKGKKVYVQGYLKTRSWDDTQGVKKYRTEIVADNIILLSSSGGVKKEEIEEDDGIPQDDFQKAKARSNKQKQEETISIEDIPF